MTRAHNFCAGPAALPRAVLERAKAELLDWSDSGSSVMEVSHRSPAFVSVAEQAEASLRRLLSISDDYAVLFLQGGASLQFAAVPLNLSVAGQAIDQVITGQWSKKAYAEGQRFGSVNVAATSEDTGFTTVPPQQAWQLDPSAAYLHYCPNETAALEPRAVHPARRPLCCSRLPRQPRGRADAEEPRFGVGGGAQSHAAQRKERDAHNVVALATWGAATWTGDVVQHGGKRIWLRTPARGPARRDDRVAYCSSRVCSPLVPRRSSWGM